MATNVLNYDAHGNKITVQLHANPFGGTTDSYYGRVLRDKVTFSNQLASIARTNTAGINQYLMVTSAGLLSDEVLNALKAGKAVEVLDLGVLYVQPGGMVSGKNPKTSDITKFKIKFESSDKLNDVVSSLSANQVVIMDGLPKINAITDLHTGSAAGTLTAGKPASISGSKVKILGAAAGLYFAPVDADGEAVSDESEWVAVPPQSIFHNYPSRLEFSVPDTLTAGARYRIVIRTSYTSGKTERRSPATVYSDTLTIA